VCVCVKRGIVCVKGNSVCVCVCVCVKRGLVCVTVESPHPETDISNDTISAYKVSPV